MPTYTAPVWSQPAPFAAPTLEQAQTEPGYQFAMEQGQKALQNAAGNKGILRTGGTLKSLLGYGQKMGEQNYQNVFNRAADIYTKNYNASKKSEAELGFNALMQQWLAKVGVAKDIFSEGARD
jgi:hypothetical protein